jgi:hypothetical protein
MACDDTTKVHSTKPEVYSVEIVATPHQPYYELGDSVRLRYVVRDRDGRELGNIGATWDNPPETEVQAQGNQEFLFIKQGFFTWSVTLEAPYLLRASATLEVRRSPASIAITVDPERDLYGIGDHVTLGYIVKDRDGLEMGDVEVAWMNPSPQEVDFLGSQSFKFVQDGLFTWTAIVIDYPELKDSVSLRVDATGPALVIDYPERGDTILGGDADNLVTVIGSVHDGMGGVESVTIRTNILPITPVDLEENGSFTIPTAAVQGLNVVVIEATDYEGNTTSTSRAYHYSSDFFAFTEDTQGRDLLPDLHNARITDQALDRGSPIDDPPYDPCRFDAQGQYYCDEIRDLATLHELALNNLDFSELNPGREFNFPLFDEAWQFNIGNIEVKAIIEGDFDLDFVTTQLDVGVAKVEQMKSYDGGIHSRVSYYPTRGENGVETPGLEVDLGVTGALSFNVWLDLYEPDLQLLLCIAAWNICNDEHPHDCLGDYLLSCSSNPTPLASAVSSFDTPLLVKLASQSMHVDADLTIGLNQESREAEVALSNFTFDFDPGSMDVSALEDLTINIGTIQIAGRVIELGTYNFPTTFVSDMVEEMLEPLMNNFTPLVSALISEAFTCEDRESPVCFLIPFMKDMLDGFVVQADMDIRNPFERSAGEPLARTHLTTRRATLGFEADLGGKMAISARIDAERARNLEAHMDDDMLGLALSDGCLRGADGFAGYDVGEKTLQLAPAFDFINMGLYAIWYNGGMDLDLGAGAFELPADHGISDLVVQARMWLPPMLTGCASDTDSVVTGLGDLHLAVSMRLDGKDVYLAGFVSLMLPGQLTADSSGLGVIMNMEDDFSFFELEIERCTVNGLIADDDTREQVVSLVRNTLSRQLLEKLTGIGLDQLRELTPSYDISRFLRLPTDTAHLSIGGFEVHRDQTHTVLNGEFVRQ